MVDGAGKLCDLSAASREASHTRDSFTYGDTETNADTAYTS